MDRLHSACCPAKRPGPGLGIALALALALAGLAAGCSTAGSATAGNATAGSATAGNATAGSATAGSAAAGTATPTAHNNGPGANKPAPSIDDAPPPNRAVPGLALSGYGTDLVAPSSPSSRPYNPDCRYLLDPAFTGTCTVAQGPDGTVAGVVEREAGATAVQERDLVWHREGDRWELADVHVEQVGSRDPGLPTLLWRDNLVPGKGQQLVFVTATGRPGFGNALDVVDGTGTVALFRFLGEGFAVAPAGGGLVTYVPGSAEADPADAYFDQTLVAWQAGTWRAIAQQYVGYRAALAEHKGAFSGPGAVPAS